ncbi:MAG: TonB-dependent receptor plug domain-containing protein, partial [Bacteroidetes bacterium]|nr:TonB-dependent receptor plug domain-containing protein [Bacteroidota bacterium]
RVTPEQIRQLPGGAEDLMRTLQTLPGVLATSDYSNQLIVRGGTPDQNLIILDEIEIFSPYQLSGVASLLNPAIVREVELYTGAFPAIYGDRLSSVLSVQTRDGLSNRWIGGEISTNMVTANLILEGKTRFWNGSWLVSGRHTYFDSFANTFAKRVGVFNEIAFPDFNDVQVKLAFRPARGHQLRFTGLRSQDALDLRPETGTFGQQGESSNLLGGDLNSENTALGVTWTYVPSATVQVKLLANWYRNEGGSDLAGGLVPQDGRLNDRGFAPPPPVFGGPDTTRFVYNQAYVLEKTTMGGQFLFTTGRHTFEFGGGADFLENGLELGIGLNEFGRQVFDAFRVANPLLGALADSVNEVKRYDRYHFYVQDKWALLGGGIFLQPSFRYDYYEITGEGYLSPRFGISILLDEATTLRFAGGRYLQSPGFEKLLDTGNLFSLSRFSRLDSLDVEQALHLGASVSRRFGERWHVKIDGYWKQLSDLITQASRRVMRPVASYRTETGPRGQLGRFDPATYTIAQAEVFELTTEPVNEGTGKAYGVELLVEKRAASRDPWSGWLSYAYARAEREQRVADEVVRFPFDYDRRHTLNLRLNRRLGRHFDLGFAWRYGTGFPYTPPVSIEPLLAVVDDPVTGATRGIVLTDPETNFVRLVPGFGSASNINSARFPAYHRLDARLTYRLDMHVTYDARGRDVSLELYLDLINLYNRKNVVSYRYIVEAVEDEATRNAPLALRKPPQPALFREPVYMFPFIPSFGFRIAF